MSESEQKVAEGAPTEESAEGTTTAVATEVSALTAEAPTEAPAERPKTPPKGQQKLRTHLPRGRGLAQRRTGCPH
jgi:hypothetical protein